MKKPVCFFTVSGDDEANQKYLKMAQNSLKKFHPDIPHIVKPFDNLHNFRIYALYGKELAKEYELVISIDNDSIVAGSLDHILNDDSYELGCVLNNNLIDPKLQMWDTPQQFYVNCGFVAIRGTRPWEWWHKLNYSPHWQHYRFREQDMLNVIFHYGDLKTKMFDHSDNWHGLVHKGQWHKMVLRDNELILPKEKGVCDNDKTIKIIHWAGGQVAKMNYWTHFKKPVAEWLDNLVKEAE